MLLKILGWIWVITGILFLWKPEWLRNRLQKKSYKKIRKIIFGLALLVGVLLINATWGVDNILAKIVMVVGVIAIIKAFFFLKSQASEKLLDWFTGFSPQQLRVWAVVQIIFGAIILTV